MAKKGLIVAVAAMLATVSTASAETIEETAAKFGALPTVLDISLSPSGSRIAYIGSGGHSTENIYVVDLANGGGPMQIFSHADPDSEIVWCLWATDDRLICKANYVFDKNGALLGFSRLYSISADGKEAIQLTSSDSSKALGLQQNGGDILALELDGKPGKILMTREWIPQASTGTHLSSTDEGLGVEEVDVFTGERHKVEQPDIEAVGYTADDRGAVRLKIRQPTDSRGYLRDKYDYYFRGAGSGKWVSFKRDDGFYPALVDTMKNVAYGFVDHDGHQAVATFALDGSGASELLLARDDADVDQLIRIGRKQRIVGISYATEKREIAYLDADLKKLADQLQRALPGKPLVDIIDASADETKLMLVASSDTDPGVAYLYDRSSRELSVLLPFRAELDGRSMGKMTPVTFPAGDGTQIPGYLTLPPGSDGKNLPAIVLPHGGPSARDEWGFDWLVQFFTARGYAVLQPNYRGSSGYGSDWFGRNGFQAWKTAIGDVNDAGHWLVGQGIADPDRLAIVGWSYGGYAALQSQVLDNTLYKAVVAIAPVTDLERLRNDSRKYTNFRLVSSFVGDGPHVAEGSPARNAKAFAAPVLLFHGTLDQNVSVEQSRLMKERLQEGGKDVTYVEYEARNHQIDDSWARTHMLIDIDTFLTKSLKR